MNVGAAGSGAYDDTNGSQLNRIGSSWVQSCCWPNAYQNTVSWANATEDAFTFTFTGSQVRYYFTKASNRGIARVTIDGVDYGTIDLYSPNAQWQQSVLYASLGPGIHTIHIAVSGQKNANSTGFFIDVDRLDVP